MEVKCMGVLIWRCEIEEPLKNIHINLLSIYFSAVL